MNAKNSILLAAMSLIMAGAAVTAASAETRFDQTHPRRAEVNERLTHQSRRINQERRDGQISPVKAERLHHADHMIRVRERRFARHDGGHITRAEQMRLNHRENRVGRRIGA